MCGGCSSQASRASDLPANLQGVWADSFRPPWNSDYHLNINLQMNYWPAEVTNLSELHLPLFDLLESLRPSGRRTARLHYNARGFVAHRITDIWGFTTPGDRARAGLWPMGAAWLCQHLWEHYQFTQDRRFLAERAYPVMKEAAEFFLDYFALHPSDQITPRGTPELAAAARKTLEHRLKNGGGHTGWSRAWIINFWARLEDGEQAYQNLLALLGKSTRKITSRRTTAFHPSCGRDTAPRAFIRSDCSCR